MFLSLHWWNNLVMCPKRIHPLQACPPPLPFVKILISIKKKKMNENYVEFDFRMGTVLVIFSFFWIDDAPLAPSYVKFLVSIFKKNENHVEFDFRIGTVLVIFSFFWTDNDLVYALLPPEWYPPLWRHHNYAHTLAHSSKTSGTILMKLWDIVPNNIRTTNFY